MAPRRDNAAKKGEIAVALEKLQELFPGCLDRLRRELEEDEEVLVRVPGRDDAAKTEELATCLAEIMDLFPGRLERFRQELDEDEQVMVIAPQRSSAAKEKELATAVGEIEDFFPGCIRRLHQELDADQEAGEATSEGHCSQLVRCSHSPGRDGDRWSVSARSLMMNLQWKSCQLDEISLAPAGDFERAKDD